MYFTATFECFGCTRAKYGLRNLHSDRQTSRSRRACASSINARQLVLVSFTIRVLRQLLYWGLLLLCHWRTKAGACSAHSAMSTIWQFLFPNFLALWCLFESFKVFSRYSFRYCRRVSYYIFFLAFILTNIVAHLPCCFWVFLISKTWKSSLKDLSRARCVGICPPLQHSRCQRNSGTSQSRMKCGSFIYCLQLFDLSSKNLCPSCSICANSFRLLPCHDIFRP